MLLSEQTVIWGVLFVLGDDFIKNFKFRKIWLKTFAGVFILGSLISLTACDDDVRVRSVSVGSSYYHPYDYYYYPNTRIYFNISTGYYYYPDRDRWVRIKRLPPRYRLNNNDRVTVRIKSKDQPYLYHNQHRAKYVPRRDYRKNDRRDWKNRRR